MSVLLADDHRVVREGLRVVLGAPQARSARRMGTLHHLHTLVWLVDKLAEGNGVAWICFLGTVSILGICFVHDLRANKRKGLVRLGTKRPEMNRKPSANRTVGGCGPPNGDAPALESAARADPGPG